MAATIALVTSLTCRYGRDTLRGAAQAARGWGWRFRHLSRPNRGVRPFPWPVDGAIGQFSPDDAQRLAGLGIPLVNLKPGATALAIDEAAVGVCAAAHFIERGLLHLAAGTAWYMDLGCARRVEGFTTAATAAGLPVIRLPTPRLPPARLRRALASWLRQQPVPLGLFCANDHLANLVLEACHLAGRQVPGEVALVGADNDEVFCELARVPLSSVAMPHEPQGAAAAERLRALLAGCAPGPDLTFAPGVVVARASSDVPNADPVLARALACISTRCAEALAVGTIADAAGVHRRALERRFRAVLGRSVHAELNAARIRRAQELLADGRLPLAAIAGAVGLSASAFAEAFTATTGQTPGMWRSRVARASCP